MKTLPHLLLCGALICLSVRAGSLESGFRQPPPEARPWVYWFWLNGNITSNGITADLEAMKRGKNELEIKVVNLWPNRLIGDEQLPENSERNPDGTLKKMAGLVAARQAKPDWTFHICDVAVVEEERCPARVRIDRTCEVASRQSGSHPMKTALAERCGIDQSHF